MALKDKWAAFGKSTGNTMKNLGKALVNTMDVAFDEKENTVDENGESLLKSSWKKVGKGFGEAGTNLGKAAAGTAKKVVDSLEEDDVEVKTENPQDEVVVDVEPETKEIPEKIE